MVSAFFGQGAAEGFRKQEALDIQHEQNALGRDRLGLLRDELSQRATQSKNKRIVDTVGQLQGMMDKFTTLRNSPNADDRLLAQTFFKNIAPKIEQYINGANANLGVGVAPVIGAPDPGNLASLRTAQAAQDRAAKAGTEGQTAKDAAIKRLMSTTIVDKNGNRRKVTFEEAVGVVDGRFVVSRHPVSQQAQIIDKISGDIIGRSAGPAAPEQPEPDIKENIDFSLGTGKSGFFGKLANIASDLIVGKIPFQGVEEAGQALENLHLQTRLTMQAAVPGRPSKFLLEQLDKFAVEPNSLFQGDARSLVRLRQTRDMLQTEVTRIDNQILAHPDDYRPAQLSAARLNKGQIEGLLKIYNRVTDSFERAVGEKQKTALPPMDKRVIGKEYDTPRGKAIWRGNGWELVGQ